jgi:hypothetical protein
MNVTIGTAPDAGRLAISRGTALLSRDASIETNHRRTTTGRRLRRHVDEVVVRRHMDEVVVRRVRRVRRILVVPANPGPSSMESRCLAKTCPLCCDVKQNNDVTCRQDDSCSKWQLIGVQYHFFFWLRVRVIYGEWGPAPERWPTAKTTAKTGTKTTARTTFQTPHSEIDRVIKAQSYRQDSDIYIPNKTHQNWMHTRNLKDSTPPLVDWSRLTPSPPQPPSWST